LNELTNRAIGEIRITDCCILCGSRFFTGTRVDGRSTNT